jgi:hypothetical protein
MNIAAVVDSGASCSCFPVTYAEELGIDLSDCEQRTGGTAGGPAEQYVWHEGLATEICGVAITLSAVFASTKVPLLGRDDVFRHFRVLFDERRRTFTLTAYEDIAADPAGG